MHSTLFKSLITLWTLKKGKKKWSLPVKMHTFGGGGYRSMYFLFKKDSDKYVDPENIGGYRKSIPKLLIIHKIPLSATL